jgi:hypothetical protein
MAASAARSPKRSCSIGKTFTDGGAIIPFSRAAALPYLTDQRFRNFRDGVIAAARRVQTGYKAADEAIEKNSDLPRLAPWLGKRSDGLSAILAHHEEQGLDPPAACFPPDVVPGVSIYVEALDALASSRPLSLGFGGLLCDHSVPHGRSLRGARSHDRGCDRVRSVLQNPVGDRPRRGRRHQCQAKQKELKMDVQQLVREVTVRGSFQGAGEVSRGYDQIASSADKAAGAVDRQSKAQESSERALDKLRRQYQDGYREQQKISEAERTYQRAVDQGLISKAAAATELGNIKVKLDQLSTSQRASSAVWQEVQSRAQAAADRSAALRAFSAACRRRCSGLSGLPARPSSPSMPCRTARTSWPKRRKSCAALPT